MTTNAKFITLLTRVLEATHAQKVRWKESPFGESYQAELPHAAIEVGVSRDADRKIQGFYAELLDDRFEAVDRTTCAIDDKDNVIQKLWNEARTKIIVSEDDFVERLVAELHKKMSEDYRIRPTGVESVDAKFQRLAEILEKSLTVGGFKWRETDLVNVFELTLTHGNIRIVGDPFQRPESPCYLAAISPDDQTIATWEPKDAATRKRLEGLFDRVRLNVIAPRSDRLIDKVLAELK